MRSKAGLTKASLNETSSNTIWILCSISTWTVVKFLFLFFLIISCSCWLFWKRHPVNRKQINVLPVSVNTRVFLNVRRKPSAVLQSDWKFYKHSFIRFSIILAHSKFLVRRSRRFRLRHVRRTGSDRNYPGWGSQSRGNRQPVWRRGENRYQKIQRRRKKKQ